MRAKSANPKILTKTPAQFISIPKFGSAPLDDWGDLYADEVDEWDGRFALPTESVCLIVLFFFFGFGLALLALILRGTIQGCTITRWTIFTPKAYMVDVLRYLRAIC